MRELRALSVNFSVAFAVTFATCCRDSCFVLGAALERKDAEHKGSESALEEAELNLVQMNEELTELRQFKKEVRGATTQLHRAP